MNSSELVARNARKYPNVEAVVCMGKTMTYQQLDASINQLANALRDEGIEAGDRVALFMPNVPEFVISYFAVQRLSAIIVPINAKFVQKEVEFVIEHAGAKALLVHEALFSAVEKMKAPSLLVKTGEAVGQFQSFEALLTSGSSSVVHCEAKEDDPSTILYTSGTTGDPKGVLFSYRNILTVANMIAVEMEVKPESRILLMMPLTHSAPLHLFLMAGVVVGSTLVLTPTFTPELFLKTIEKERTTHFFGAPVAYLLTASHPAIKQTDLSSMQWWIYGGAPLSTKEVRFLQQAFRSNQFVCVYGLTEAGPSGSLLLAHEHEKKAGSIGRRAPLHTELRVVDEEGNDVRQGEVGEIVLYGEGNMLGYYNNEEATKAAFINGWLKTGDLARTDEDGFIWIVDRKKDVILTGGVTVYPKEIEDAILLFDGIREVAVIGVPHQEWGETVKAVFAASNTVPIDALKQHLQQQLASYKIPKLFEQVEELPRNASGKILKQSLRESGGRIAST